MAKKATKTKTSKIACKECGHEDHYLADHLMEAHSMTVEEYLAKHPGAETVSNALVERFQNEKGNARRHTPPNVDELTIEFAGVSPVVNHDVPAMDCLPCPPQYRTPEHGKLGRKIQHAAISLLKSRTMYIWGLPGAGKDALFHAWSAMTRTPAKIFTVQPGVDIQSWFFSRSFDEKGTTWEEGEFLKAARDGYTTATGRVIPMLLLISDFDRADRSQAEHVRLIMDSIGGRIMGPGGTTYPVLPGTMIVATGNSAGSGDTRGRCISSNPIDASILDRFERKYELHWMDWRDEVEIAKAKFPLLNERAPEIFNMVGKATGAIRQAILSDELYAEFSHRALCAWLGHATDLLEIGGNRAVPANLLKKAACAFLDGMPDEETRLSCKRLMDPHLKGGAVDEGDTSHIHEGEELAEGWA
jgi:MoxR-like ATPase